MIQREAIIQALWSRFAAVDGVVFTARNPKDPPSIENLPCIQFFELGDVVTKPSRRGATQKPSYQRVLTVVAEVFMVAQTESSASNEMMDMLEKVKSQVYSDGNSLGGLCEIVELESSRVLRPPIGGPVIGLGIAFEIKYFEDTSNY